MIASCGLISVLLVIGQEDSTAACDRSLLLMSKVRTDMEIGLELMEGIGNNYLIGD